MEATFFKKQIDRLQKTYGDASYPDESIMAIWSELKHIPQEKFAAAITRVLAVYVSAKYPPGIDKIESVLSQLRENEYEIEKHEATTSGLDGKTISDFMSEIQKEL